MAEPNIHLHRAVFAALTAAPGVAEVVGERIYDLMPPARNVVFPYITFGPFMTGDDGSECIEASRIEFDINVWSRAGNSAEAKALVGAVRAALHMADLDLSPVALVEIVFDGSRVFLDEDGATVHGVASFIALTEDAP